MVAAGPAECAGDGCSWVETSRTSWFFLVVACLAWWPGGGCRGAGWSACCWVLREQARPFASGFGGGGLVCVVSGGGRLSGVPVLMVVRVLVCAGARGGGGVSGAGVVASGGRGVCVNWIVDASI